MAQEKTVFLTLSLDTVVMGKFKDNTNINRRFIFFFYTEI